MTEPVLDVDEAIETIREAAALRSNSRHTAACAAVADEVQRLRVENDKLRMTLARVVALGKEGL